jgi:hypothetical protein
MNATGGLIPRFYIFQSERIKSDYVKHCKFGTCMAIQTKTWMTSFLLKEFLSFFKRSILGGIFPSNHHLLILDGHGSHVNLEVIEQAQQFGLDMITLPSHTSHVLQPLDVSYFKPFKTTLNNNYYYSMVSNNYKEPNKIIFANWVDKALNAALSKRNLKNGFKVIGIWPFNPKVMDGRTKPSELYTTKDNIITLDEENA